MIAWRTDVTTVNERRDAWTTFGLVDIQGPQAGTTGSTRWSSLVVPAVARAAREETLFGTRTSDIGIDVVRDDVRSFALPFLFLGASRRQVLEVGGLEIDLAAHRVHLFGSPLSLTALEFGLLRALAWRVGWMLDRRFLYREVWGITAEISSRRLDSLVARLRSKIRGASVGIRTVHGVGYRLDSLDATRRDS
jgi:DNA-binding response OmpR family regulator